MAYFDTQIAIIPAGALTKDAAAADEAPITGADWRDGIVLNRRGADECFDRLRAIAFNAKRARMIDHGAAIYGRVRPHLTGGAWGAPRLVLRPTL